MLLIREYVHQLDWNDICKIHDKARILELEESAPKEAFIPLEECYKVEKLFDSIIFVAEQNNETVGFVAFCDNSITWLYVEPKFFRNGYGRMLLDFVLNRISKPASVTVLNNNFRAIALYKSCGFKVHSEKKGIIPLTNVEVISLKMVLSK